MTKGEIAQRDWVPLLEGDAAARARDVVEDIAVALTTIDNVTADLTSGASGIALFFAYLAAASGDEPAHSDRATHFVELAASLASSGLTTSSFWGGYTGLGWVLAHLLEQEHGDANDGIDQVLALAVQVPDWTGDYDLINGLAGLALYALERLPRRTAREALSQIVEHLSRQAETDARGICWFTPPRLLMPQQLQRVPNGFYNLGVAHGIPAIVNILGRLVRAGIAIDESRRLLNGSVSWLLSQQRCDEETRFPYWIANGRPESGPTRNAWCYGDLGVAAAVYGAARFVDEPSWQEEALLLARAAARRPTTSCGVVDAGLCHGSFGLAHMFMRFYDATGDAVFEEAARRWLEHGLAMRRPLEDFAGFPTWNADARRFTADPGLLTGAAGVGLVLLAATSHVRPAWDRLLLLDLDGRQT